MQNRRRKRKRKRSRDGSIFVTKKKAQPWSLAAAPLRRGRLLSQRLKLKFLDSPSPPILAQQPMTTPTHAGLPCLRLLLLLLFLPYHLLGL